MSHVRKTRSGFRRPSNLSLGQQIVADAKEIGINLPRASKAGLGEAIRAERNRLWKEENREANAAYVEYLEKNRLSFAEYRRY